MKYSTTLILFILALRITAQSNVDSTHHCQHQHHKNEIGVSNAPVYLIAEKEVAYGFHAHYVRKISHTKFGLGAGFERIFDEHSHTTIGLVANYRPIEFLNFNIAPGLTMEQNSFSNLNYAIHFEGAYEFEIGNFHIGPAFEYAFEPEDSHISLGLHLGIGF